MSREQDEYKFMTNLFIRPRDRTRYVEPLKKFTVDPQISYQRIFIGLGASVFSFLIIMIILLSSGAGELYYIWFSVILLIIASSIIILLYVLPSRGKSMLASVSDLALFRMIEKVRLKSPDASIGSVGIKSISSDGIITFDDKEVGCLYKIEGQIGLSTLPRVASDVANARLQYLVERQSTTQEKLITSISKLDLNRQLEYYRHVQEENQSLDDDASLWRNYMASIIHTYAKESIHNRDTSIKQYIILRDISESKLVKAKRIFEKNVNNGCLSSSLLINGRSEVEKVLRNLVLSTKGGDIE